MPHAIVFWVFSPMSVEKLSLNEWVMRIIDIQIRLYQIFSSTRAFIELFFNLFDFFLHFAESFSQSFIFIDFE